MSDTLDKANDAAEGDLGALKYLALGLTVLAFVGGTVAGGVWYLGKHFGETIRDTIMDAFDGAAQNTSSPTSSGSDAYGGS